MKQHITPIRTNILVFIALLGPAVRDGRGRLSPPGRLALPVAMAIAVAKAVLIVLFFMHLLYSHRLTMVVCIASFLWLAIMIALTLSDYLSRGRWLNIPGK